MTRLNAARRRPPCAAPRPARLGRRPPSPRMPSRRPPGRRAAAGRDRRPRRRARAPTRPPISPASLPRNALDMLNNVPGFAIVESDTERRGLGQATGNVLINGERFSGKSTDIFTELRRISAANVTRIEIVDGATLNISGLSGQVANIITANRGLSGNFVYRPQIRARRTPARLLNGEISINGSLDPATQYSLSFRNDSFRNGNAGPEMVSTPGRRDPRPPRRGALRRRGAAAPVGTLRRNFGDGSILNANAAFGLYHLNADETSPRSNPGQRCGSCTSRSANIITSSAAITNSAWAAAG